MSLKSRIMAQWDCTEPMSRWVWSDKLCFLVLMVCTLTAPAPAEGLWEDIYLFNGGGFGFARGSQRASRSDMAEQTDAPFDIGQALEQVAESALEEGQSQTGSRDGDVAAEVGKTSSHPLIAKSPKTDITRQLWQARINISGDTKQSESKDELRRIIREISSIGFEPRQEAPEVLIVVEPIGKTDANETASDKGMPREDESGKIEHKLPYRRVSEETLQVLKSLSEHPEQLHNPLELGEILFSSQCLKEAAKCYQEALNRMTAGEPGQARDGAWLLFQTGNCLWEDDPATAIQMYGQLIAQYPASPWAALGKAKSELVDWYLKDAPEALIEECKLPALQQ